MRKRKRILLCLLALVMALVLMPKRAVTASGADATEKEDGDIIIDIGGQTTVASGSCGENLTWKLNGNGVFTVSGTGAMTNYSSTGSRPWNSKSSSITKVVVEKGVTRIGNRAFSGCTKLTAVTIPASVTAIGTQAFYNCTGLQTVSFGGAKVHWAQVSIGSGNTPLKSATVSFDLMLYGDVNGDGAVDTRDRVLLTRYLAQWEDCTVDMAAADVNRDGAVDARDRTILSRHLADWAGYSQLPYTE